MKRNYANCPHFVVKEAPGLRLSENLVTKPHRHSRSHSPARLRKHANCERQSTQSRINVRCPVHGLLSSSRHSRVQSESCQNQESNECESEGERCLCSDLPGADSGTIEHESEVEVFYRGTLMPTAISMQDLHCTEDIGFYSINSRSSLCHCASRQLTPFDAEYFCQYPCLHDAIVQDSSTGNSTVSSSERDIMKCRLSDLFESNDRAATSYLRRPINDPCIINSDARTLVSSFFDTTGEKDSSNDCSVKFVTNTYIPCVEQTSTQSSIKSEVEETLSEQAFQTSSYRVKSCPSTTMKMSATRDASRGLKATLNDIDEVEVKESTEVIITGRMCPLEIPSNSNTTSAQQEALVNICRPEFELCNCQERKSPQPCDHKREVAMSNSKNDICHQHRRLPNNQDSCNATPRLNETTRQEACNPGFMNPGTSHYKQIREIPANRKVSYVITSSTCGIEKTPCIIPCSLCESDARETNPCERDSVHLKPCKRQMEADHQRSCSQDRRKVKPCDGNRAETKSSPCYKDNQTSSSEVCETDSEDSNQSPCVNKRLSPKLCEGVTKHPPYVEKKQITQPCDMEDATPNHPCYGKGKHKTEPAPCHKKNDTTDQSPCGKYRNMFGPVSCRNTERAEKSPCGKDKQMFGPNPCGKPKEVSDQFPCGKTKNIFPCDKDTKHQQRRNKYRQGYSPSPCNKEKRSAADRPCNITRDIDAPCKVRKQSPVPKSEPKIIYQNRRFMPCDDICQDTSIWQENVIQKSQPCSDKQNIKPFHNIEEKPRPCNQQQKIKPETCDFCDFYEEVIITKPQICDWEQKINMALTDIVEFKEVVEEFDDTHQTPVYKSCYTKREEISPVERSSPCQGPIRSSSKHKPCECRHEKIAPCSLEQERSKSPLFTCHNQRELQEPESSRYQQECVHQYIPQSRTQPRVKTTFQQTYRSQPPQNKMVCFEQDTQAIEKCGCGRELGKPCETSQLPVNRSSESDESQSVRYRQKANNSAKLRPYSSRDEINTRQSQPLPIDNRHICMPDPTIEYQYHISDRRQYVYNQTNHVQKPQPSYPCEGNQTSVGHGVPSVEAPCPCRYERRVSELKPGSNREEPRLRFSEIEDCGCKGDDESSENFSSDSHSWSRRPRSRKRANTKEGSATVRSFDTNMSTPSSSAKTVPICPPCVSDSATTPTDPASSNVMTPCCKECTSCMAQQNVISFSPPQDALFKPIQSAQDGDWKNYLASFDEKMKAFTSASCRGTTDPCLPNRAKDSNSLRPCSPFQSSGVVRPCPRSHSHSGSSSAKSSNNERPCPGIVTENITSDICDYFGSGASQRQHSSDETKKYWFSRKVPCFWRQEAEDSDRRSCTSEPVYRKQNQSYSSKVLKISSKSTTQPCSTDSYVPPSSHARHEVMSCLESPTSSSTYNVQPCFDDEQQGDDFESEESYLPSPPELECFRASQPTDMQTQIVMVLSSEIPLQTIAWLMKRLQDPVGEEGGQLQVKVVPKHSQWPPMMHIGAHDLRMLQAAEMQDMIKRDKNGCIQYFALENVERFMNEAKHLPSVLTPAEKQRVVYQILMKEVRILPCEKTLPGKCHIKLFPGHSAVQVCKQQGLITHIFALHDATTLKKVRKGWLHVIYSDKRLDEIRTYYGETVVVYLTFTALFTLFLAIPAFAAINMLLFNSLPKIDNQYFLVAVVGNVLVIIAMLVLWHRRCGSLAACWGAPMLQRPPSPRENFAGKTVTRHQITGRYEPNYPAWKRTSFMMLISYPFVVLMLVLAVVCTNSYYLSRQDYMNKAPEERTWNDTFMDLGNVIMFSTFVFFMVKLLDFAASLITEWENHRTEAEFNSHRVFKIVILAYVWNFYSFYYALFYLNAFMIVARDLAWFVGTSLLWNVITRGLIPYLRLRFFFKPRRGSRYRQSVLPQPSGEAFCAKEVVRNPEDSCDEQIKTISSIEGFTKDKDVTRADEELDLQPYEGEYTDYLDKLVHFGFAFLFTALAPLTVLLIILHNIFHIIIIEFRLGSLFQRPIVVPSYSMGLEWQQALRAVGVLAVMTNISLLFYSDYLRQMIPFEISDRYWILFLVLAEHVVIAIYAILDILIVNLPCSNCLGKEKLCHEIRLEERKAKFYRMQGYLCNLTKHSCSMTRYPGLAVQRSKLKKKNPIL